MCGRRYVQSNVVAAFVRSHVVIYHQGTPYALSAFEFINMTLTPVQSCLLGHPVPKHPLDQVSQCSQCRPQCSQSPVRAHSARRAESQQGQGDVERQVGDTHDISNFNKPTVIETLRSASAVLSKDEAAMRVLLPYAEATKTGHTRVSDIKGAQTYMNTHRYYFSVHAHMDPQVYHNIYPELIRIPGEVLR